MDKSSKCQAGQIVKNAFPNVGNVFVQYVQYVDGMTGDSKTDERTFNAGLLARVRGIRESKGWTAEQMAMALGIPADRYRKYENRTPIPHYLIPRVALIAGRSSEWVLTGKEPKSSAGASRKPRA